MSKQEIGQEIVISAATVVGMIIVSKVAGKLAYKAMNWNHKRRTGQTLEETYPVEA